MEQKTNITKKDIVNDISMRTGCTQVQTKIVIESFMKSLIHGLIERNDIQIRGFGRFKLKERKQKIARNPRNGETVIINACTKPVFEASKELIKSLNKVLIDAEKSLAMVDKND